jgi:hypothetical protein
MEECIYESLCSQEVSIKIQGAYHYLRHPRQDIYLAAIYGRDFSFCGDPAKAPWEALNGFTTRRCEHLFSSESGAEHTISRFVRRSDFSQKIDLRYVEANY